MTVPRGVMRYTPRPMPVPRPRSSILDAFVRLSRAGRPVWRDDQGHLYTWDALHGEVEAFTSRGYHLGALDPQTGKMISGAVRGRKLEL